MSISGARIGAQAAAHFQSRQFRHHPVDKRPHRSFDQTPRPFRPHPIEGKAAVIVDEILKAFAKLVGQENIDDIHALPAPLSHMDWRKRMTSS